MEKLLVICSMSLLLVKGDVCQLPKSIGLCDDIVQKWFYNSEKQVCETFYYGGCGGNANNFPNERACQEACLEGYECLLPKQYGSCEALIERWFYNTEKEVCEKFYYGGCDGNANNFPNQTACNNFCLRGYVCKLRKNYGTCQGSFERWFYNYEKEVCETFSYGGCHGNPNNFPNETLCYDACVEDVCQLQKRVGSCTGSNPMWFYNNDTEACEPFNYGGCEGNANKFQTQKACHAVCLKGTGGSTGLQSSMVAMVLAVIAGWISARL